MFTNYEEKFEESPDKLMYGNILIKGTKTSLRSIIREIFEGKAPQEIVNLRPELSLADIQSCLEYASELVGAVDFKKSMAAINSDRQKRKVLADKIRALKIHPPQFFKDASGAE